MFDTRTSDHDDEQTCANQAGDGSRWVKHAVRAPVMDVYVLVAHPHDSTSFVVDVYETRAAAEADRAAFDNVPVDVVPYTVDLAEREGPCGGW